MSEYFPLLAAILFVIVSFIVAMQKGVVSLLASGLALASALAVLSGVVGSLPGLSATHLDLDPGWKPTFALAGGAALAVFIAVRVFGGIVLKKVFNSDSPLHRWVDGVPGGILSIGPSLVTLVVFFTCVRAAGTVQELNYLDSLAQPGIDRAGGRIPSPPPSIAWRNGLETLPFVADLLDRLDPFSRRAARHTAAMLIISGSVELRAHLLNRPATGTLLESTRWPDLAADPAVTAARSSRDRIALVTAPAVQAAAAEADLRGPLEALVLLPELKSFAASLVPVAEPAPQP
jgi:hypothetical protein